MKKNLDMYLSRVALAISIILLLGSVYIVATYTSDTKKIVTYLHDITQQVHNQFSSAIAIVAKANTIVKEITESIHIHGNTIDSVLSTSEFWYDNLENWQGTLRSLSDICNDVSTVCLNTAKNLPIELPHFKVIMAEFNINYPNNIVVGVRKEHINYPKDLDVKIGKKSINYPSGLDVKTCKKGIRYPCGLDIHTSKIEFNYPKSITPKIGRFEINVPDKVDVKIKKLSIKYPSGIDFTPRTILNKEKETLEKAAKSLNKTSDTLTETSSAINKTKIQIKDGVDKTLATIQNNLTVINDKFTDLTQTDFPIIISELENEQKQIANIITLIENIKPMILPIALVVLAVPTLLFILALGQYLNTTVTNTNP